MIEVSFKRTGLAGYRLGAGDAEKFTPTLSPSAGVQEQAVVQAQNDAVNTAAPSATIPNRTGVYNTTCPACPPQKPWYIFVGLGAIGGSLLTGVGLLIRESMKKGKRR